MPRVESVTAVLVLIGAAIAFVAGARWQHTKRTWADHRLARTGERNFRKMRWTTSWAAAVVAVFLVAYLLGVVNLAVNGEDDGSAKPRSTPTSTQTPADNR
jgi:hypothetical protein